MDKRKHESACGYEGHSRTATTQTQPMVNDFAYKFNILK